MNSFVVPAAFAELNIMAPASNETVPNRYRISPPPVLSRQNSTPGTTPPLRSRRRAAVVGEPKYPASLCILRAVLRDKACRKVVVQNRSRRLSEAPEALGC